MVRGRVQGRRLGLGFRVQGRRFGLGFRVRLRFVARARARARIRVRVRVGNACETLLGRRLLRVDRQTGLET